MRHGDVRFERPGPVVTRQRLLVSLEAMQGHGAVHERIGVVCLENNGGLVMGQGFREAVQPGNSTQKDDFFGFLLPGSDPGR